MSKNSDLIKNGTKVTNTFHEELLTFMRLVCTKGAD